MEILTVISPFDPVQLGTLIKPGMDVCLALHGLQPSNSLSGGIQGNIGQARNRNGKEPVRPQFERAPQILI